MPNTAAHGINLTHVCDLHLRRDAMVVEALPIGVLNDEPRADLKSRIISDPNFSHDRFRLMLTRQAPLAAALGVSDETPKTVLRNLAAHVLMVGDEPRASAVRAAIENARAAPGAAPAANATRAKSAATPKLATGLRAEVAAIAARADDATPEQLRSDVQTLARALQNLLGG